MKYLNFVVLFVCALSARGFPAETNLVTDDTVSGSPVWDGLKEMKECIDENVALCLKEKALKYATKLASEKEVTVTDGVSLIENETPRSARSFEPLPLDPLTRETEIDSRLVDMVMDFLETRTLQLRLPSDMQRSLEEGRKKKKKKILKKLLPILALIKLKAAALIPLFLGIIAIVAVKALLIGKIALISSAVGIIRTLLAGKGKGGIFGGFGGGGGAPEHVEEYPYPASGQPQGWGRKMEEAQNLAYNAHEKKIE